MWIAHLDFGAIREKRSPPFKAHPLWYGYGAYAVPFKSRCKPKAATSASDLLHQLRVHRLSAAPVTTAALTVVPLNVSTGDRQVASVQNQADRIGAAAKPMSTAASTVSNRLSTRSTFRHDGAWSLAFTF